MSEKTNETCPLCGKTYSGYPALSRVDNKTDICSDCGTREAMRPQTVESFRALWKESKVIPVSIQTALDNWGKTQNQPDLKCPHCKEDLRETLMFVEDGCTNYIYYKQGSLGEWFVEHESNGENTSETYYACRSCGERLPDELQTYFEEQI